jgi:hypothetical protein
MKPLLIVFFALTAGGSAQQFFQWSDWVPTTDTSTEYRYEITGDDLLSIQFLNDSKTPHRFDYEIVIPGQEQTQHGNASLKGHKMSAEINVATNRGRPPSKVLVTPCDGAACKY